MELLNNHTFIIVAIGSTLLGAISGVLGCFAVLRKQSLLGDGVAHSALSGIVIAFMLFGNKNLEVLLLGGLISGLLATLLIIFITKNSRIKFDSALAMVLSVFFGLGLVLLTLVQKQSNSNQAGIENFIYGQASSMLLRDVKIIGICGIILISIIILFWKEFKLLSFDIEFARTVGFNTNVLNLLLTLLLIISIIIGLQSVGVILMSTMLIAPAVGARQWVNSLSAMVILSSFFGAISGFLGTLISSLSPKTPTGPVIVIIATIIAFFSILIAPKITKYSR